MAQRRLNSVGAAIDGVAKETVAACRLSKTQISFVLKIEKTECIFIQLDDYNEEILCLAKRQSRVNAQVGVVHFYEFCFYVMTY